MKKFILPFLTLVGILAITAQVIFDVKAFRTFGALAAENNIMKQFIVQNFPEQVKAFNDSLPK